MTKPIIIATVLALAACGGVQQPADPAVLARVVKACMGSGLFKLVDGTVATFVPQATLPIALVNAGVDRVCSDPEAFAADASAVEQAIRQLENFKR